MTVVLTDQEGNAHVCELLLESKWTFPTHIMGVLDFTGTLPGILPEFFGFTITRALFVRKLITDEVGISCICPKFFWKANTC